MKTLGFIGGGRITRIFLNGFKNAEISFENISVFEINKSVLSLLQNEFPLVQFFDSEVRSVASADIIFVALHPPQLQGILYALNGLIPATSMIVSLAPKITLNELCSGLPGNPNIARMIPNAGSYLNNGFNPVTFAPGVIKSVKEELINLFEKLGKVPVVRENHLEGYAMISAMGPTYFWFQINHLRDMAVQFGIPENIADECISIMLHGTTETLFNSGLTYDQVIDLVPVRPIAESEKYIKDIYSEKLISIYNKIKPELKT